MFSYQARKVSACIDAPSGTQLAVAVRFEEHPELGDISALAPRDVSTGPVALCVHNPMPELSGSLRVRFTLTAPDGTITQQYSPDHVTALSGQGNCVESDTVCCDFEQTVQAEDPLPMGAAGTGASGGGGNAKAEHGGCNVVHVRGAGAGCAQLIVLLLLRVTIMRRRRVLGLLLVLLVAGSDARPCRNRRRRNPARPLVPSRSSPPPTRTR